MTATASVSGLVTISRRPLDLEDYIDVARRHIGWIAGPLFAGLVVSVVVAFMLPNSYRSDAVMQITPAQISEALVPTTIVQQLNERLMTMQGNITSRTSLSNLIQSPDLNLYPTERQKQPIEDVIETMRGRDLHISIETIPGLATKHASAFKISFTYVNRFKAQATVQKVMTRFVDENTSSQRQQQSLLSNFFNDELAQAKANLEKANEEVTKFRTENEGRLPEQSMMNMTQLNSLDTQMRQTNDQINRLMQERVQLETRLSTLKTQMDLAGTMSQEYNNLSVNSPIARQNQDIEVLNKQIDNGEAQLALYLRSFKETYPDIRNLRKSLDVMKQRRNTMVAAQEQVLAEEASKPKEPVKKRPNFQLMQNETNLQGQIDATNTQLKNNDMERAFRVKELDALHKQSEQYRSKLAATSAIEAHYADLKRDQENAAAKYQSMLGKQELAAQNQDLVQRKASETLDVLDPPSLPVNPSSPNRWFIVGAGVGISFMLGLALAGIQEAKDTSLKNLKDVRAYTNLPVLCSIPLLENTLLVKRKRRIAYLAWSAAVIIGIIAVCASLFYYYSVTVNS